MTHTSGSKINTKSVYGLLPSSTYEFQLQTACSSTDASGFSPSGTFTTKSYCGGAPGRLFVSDLDTSSAVLSWSDISSSVTYKIKYAISGSGAWVYKTSPINSIAISNLSPAKNYEFQVQTICSTGASAYSTSYLFTTPSKTPIAPVNIDVNVSGLLSTISSHPVGINMNYLIQINNKKNLFSQFNNVIFEIIKVLIHQFQK